MKKKYIKPKLTVMIFEQDTIQPPTLDDFNSIIYYKVPIDPIYREPNIIKHKKPKMPRQFQKQHFRFKK